jgi:hypothetical protein
VSGISGVWQLDTRSLNSMMNILGAIQLAQRAFGGHIALRRFKLRLMPLTVAPEGTKKTVYILHLVVPLPVLPEAKAPAALPEPDDEIEDDLAVVSEEGHTVDIETGEVIVPEAEEQEHEAYGEPIEEPEDEKPEEAMPAPAIRVASFGHPAQFEPVPDPAIEAEVAAAFPPEKEPEPVPPVPEATPEPQPAAPLPTTMVNRQTGKPYTHQELVDLYNKWLKICANAKEPLPKTDAKPEAMNDNILLGHIMEMQGHMNAKAAKGGRR